MFVGAVGVFLLAVWMKFTFQFSLSSWRGCGEGQMGEGSRVLLLAVTTHQLPAMEVV